MAIKKRGNPIWSLRSILVRNIRDLRNARRSTTAVNLLHGHSFVQNLLVVDGAGLQDLDAAESLALDPHDRSAGRAVVVGQIFARVAETGVRAVGAGELLELRRGG
jgi:hypothetical protein